MKTKNIISIIVLMLLLISSVLAVATAPDSDDVVLELRFEDSSTTLDDTSANTNDFTTYHSPTAEQTGILNYAYDFEYDTKQYAKADDHSTFDITDDISLSVWLKPESFESFASGAGWYKDNILVKAGASGTRSWGFYATGGYLSFASTESGTSWITTSTTNSHFSTGSWVHVGIVFDNSNNDVEFFVNGVSVENVTHTTSGIYSSSQDVFLGSYGGATNIYSFDTLYDELLLFDAKLSGSNMRYLYADGSPSEAQEYDFPTPSSFEITNTNSINNMTAYFNSTSYSTTNGTINTGLDSTEEFTIIIESNEGHYFNKTYTDHNLSSSLSATLTEYPRINIYSLWDSSVLSSFNVTYDTTTIDDIAGTAWIPLNISKSITIAKTNYFPKTLTHDFTDSNDLNTSMFQSEINITLRESITNNTISNWELYEDATKIAESTGNSVIKYMNAKTYSNLTMKSKDASFTDRSIDNFTITALDNKTEYIYIFLADLNISAYSSVTSNPIMNFTINVNSYNHTDTRNLSTTTGSIIIPVTLSDFYNVSIDAYGYALFEYYTDIEINESPKYYNFSLYTNNSISFSLRDEATSALVTETLFITLTGDNVSYSYNTSTGLYYADEVQDGNYSVKIWNANYDPKYYVVTVADRSHQTLDAYLSTDYSTAIFTFKDEINNDLLAGVFFTQSRIVNGTWTVVATKYSDITGRLPTSYVADTAYRITIIKSGYESNTFDLDPFLFETYTVYMDRETSSTDIIASDVAIIIDPTTFYEGINNLTITLISPLGSLASYWVNITYPSSYNYTSGNNSQGEIFTIPINITSSNLFEKVVIEYHFETSLGFTRTQTYIYGIVPADTYVGTFAQNKLNDYGLGLFERIAIAIFAIMIIAGFVYALAGIGGALVVAMILLGVAQQLNFIPLSALLITFLVGFILVVAMKWGSS